MKGGDAGRLGGSPGEFGIGVGDRQPGDRRVVGVGIQAEATERAATDEGVPDGRGHDPSYAARSE